MPEQAEPGDEPLGDVVEGDAHEDQEAPEDDGVEKAGDRPLGEHRDLQQHPVGHGPQAPQRAVEAGDLLPAGDQAVFPEEFAEGQADGQGDGGDKQDLLDE